MGPLNFKPSASVRSKRQIVSLLFRWDPESRALSLARWLDDGGADRPNDPKLNSAGTLNVALQLELIIGQVRSDAVIFFALYAALGAAIVWIATRGLAWANAGVPLLAWSLLIIFCALFFLFQRLAVFRFKKMFGEPAKTLENAKRKLLESDPDSLPPYAETYLDRLAASSASKLNSSIVAAAVIFALASGSILSRASENPIGSTLAALVSGIVVWWWLVKLWNV